MDQQHIQVYRTLHRSSKRRQSVFSLIFKASSRIPRLIVLAPLVINTQCNGCILSWFHKLLVNLFLSTISKLKLWLKKKINIQNACSMVMLQIDSTIMVKILIPACKCCRRGQMLLQIVLCTVLQYSVLCIVLQYSVLCTVLQYSVVCTVLQYSVLCTVPMPPHMLLVTVLQYSITVQYYYLPVSVSYSTMVLYCSIQY